MKWLLAVILLVSGCSSDAPILFIDDCTKEWEHGYVLRESIEENKEKLIVRTTKNALYLLPLGHGGIRFGVNAATCTCQLEEPQYMRCRDTKDVVPSADGAKDLCLILCKK